jgi:thiol-disulfide isomerase/thioredoxin
METAPGGQLAAVKEGSAAPDFSLQTLEGTEASLRQFRGGPVLVTFWASWCAPCMVELQALGRLEDMPDGPVVIAVNMGEDRETAQSALARAGADLLCLLDSDQRTARRYGAWSLPTSVMVDADGIVRSARVGAMGLEELEAFVETAMPAGGARNGRPSRSPRPQSEDEAYPASSDGQHDAGRHVSESG